MSFPGDRPSGQGRRRPPTAFDHAFGPDPFGMIGGSSLLDSFFGRDPFDDPFFTRPMGMMGMLGGGMFGGGVLGRNPMGMGFDSFFDRAGFFTRPDGSLLGQRPFDNNIQPQLEARRGPVIEELSDDVEGTEKAQQQPIVEHPDDDEVTGSVQRGVENQLQTVDNFQSRHHRRPVETGYHSNNVFQSFSYQTSSVSYGGSGGSFYSSSSMRRVGPDGVIQEEHVQKDSSGKETRTAARGLRDKMHAITKKRNAANDPESTVETLRNLTPEEAPQFDAQWEANANRSLPGWNSSHAQMLESSGQRGSQRAAPALPYSHPTRKFRS